MRFKDILNAISNDEIIVESDEVPSILGKRKEYMNIRDVNRTKMTKSKEKYKDDQRYNDYKGKQWLNTTASDKLTLTLAILDGCADTHKDGLRHEDYMSIETKEDIDRILENNPRIKSIVSEILSFLGKYLNQKEITVYRGININSDILANIYDADKLSYINPQRFINIFSNEGKEFNSFSVNPHISDNFAKDYGGNGKNYIILQGKANKQDINWAFTAYLMGRHGTTGEAELNINNIRTLKDLRIMKDKSNLNIIYYIDISDIDIQKKFIDQFNNNKIDKLFKYKYCYDKFDKHIIRLYETDELNTNYLIFPLSYKTNKIISKHGYTRYNRHDNTYICRNYNGTYDIINNSLDWIIYEDCKNANSIDNHRIIVYEKNNSNVSIIDTITSKSIETLEELPTGSTIIQIKLIEPLTNLDVLLIKFLTSDDKIKYSFIFNDIDGLIPMGKYYDDCFTLKYKIDNKVVYAVKSENDKIEYYTAANNYKPLMIEKFPNDDIYSLGKSNWYAEDLSNISALEKPMKFYHLDRIHNKLSLIYQNKDIKRGYVGNNLIRLSVNSSYIQFLYSNKDNKFNCLLLDRLTDEIINIYTNLTCSNDVNFSLATDFRSRFYSNIIPLKIITDGQSEDSNYVLYNKVTAECIDAKYIKLYYDKDDSNKEKMEFQDINTGKKIVINV